MNNINHTKDRFISYMDIMGFKDFVYRHSHTEVVDYLSRITNLIGQFESTREKAKGTQLEAEMPEMVVFSDSIVLISKGNTKSDFKVCINISSLILAYCLSVEPQIPIKGAVAYGTLTYDKSKSLLVGLPLIDTYFLADSLQFYGIVLHNTAEKIAKAAGWIDKQEIQVAPIPIKEAGMVNHHFLELKGALYLQSIGDANPPDPNELLLKLYDSVAGKPRKYVDNTIQVYGDLTIKSED